MSPTWDTKKTLNLPSEDNTFASFKHRSGAEKSYRAFKLLADGKTDVPFLLCHGQYGNGKTHLLQAAILKLWRRGIICRYQTFEEVCQHIKSGMQTGAVYSADQITQGYCERKCLAIDDFGLGSETLWAEGRLNVIIEYRYRHRLLTILVTNQSLAELPGRVESRFSDPEVGVVVLNEASDYRKRKVK